MLSVIVLFAVAVFIYGFVVVGSGIIDSTIHNARHSSGKKLRKGVFLLILRNGSLCMSQISALLGVPIGEIAKEIDFLRTRRVLKEMDEPIPPTSETCYIVGGENI